MYFPSWTAKCSSCLLYTSPTFSYGLRGLAGAEIIVKGPSADLHSGVFGGAVANPIAALAEIITSFHDEDGRVAVRGFYAGVELVSYTHLDVYKRQGLGRAVRFPPEGQGCILPAHVVHQEKDDVGALLGFRACLFYTSRCV